LKQIGKARFRTTETSNVMYFAIFPRI